MTKKELPEVSNEMITTCQFLRKELMDGFNDLKTLKNSGQITDADLDYELARDRKAGLTLKSIIVELGVEKINNRRINQVDNK